MVCAAIEEPARIIGGFVLVPVASLMATWASCQSRPLGIGDFRTWLAALEMVARRQTLQDGREPAYGPAELARLLGVTRKRAGASLRRLQAAGLVEWSDSAIAFPGPILRYDAEHLVDTIGRGTGSVAIPRRILRFLGSGARPALIASILGILLRCLSRRKAGFDGRGRVKASWIAGAFGVDLRRVKAARKELVALGWIAPEPSGQRLENRWGRAFRIDLGWARPRAGGRSLPPPSVVEPLAIATPSFDREPLPEREKDQEPRPAGASGASLQGPGTGTPSPAARPPSPSPPTLPAPTLDAVRLEDLADTARLLALHRQAIVRGVVTASEADRLRFVGAARHALAIGKGNPPGLFAWLIRGRCWRYIAQADEDEARRQLHRHDHGDRAMVDRAIGSRLPTPRRIDPGPSEDARIVREIRSAMIRAGIFRDPWPAFSVRYSEWDRARWDRALAELGLG